VSPDLKGVATGYLLTVKVRSTPNLHFSECFRNEEFWEKCNNICITNRQKLRADESKGLGVLCVCDGV
jgi:hypothetical protein